MKKILVLFLIIIFMTNLTYNAEKKGGVRFQTLSKTMATSDVWVDVNRMNGVFRNNGIWHHDVVAGDWGLEWQKGSGNSPMFGAGQWLGAIVDGEVRVAGVQHTATEFQPGEITAPFQATNPKDSKYRWYVVKSDGTGDWTGWPVEQGAPVDENGRPLLIGDITMFSVWNDLAEHAEYSTKKLSAEVRQVVFAFNRQDAMGDMQFIKWQITNKSGMNWDSTYFAIWTDPDLGEALDDFVGCDTTLGLGYCYNADDNDQNYGSAPPAIGIDFFQGPVIEEEGSTVSLPNGIELMDTKMLKMTSFVYYNNDRTAQGNPFTGSDVWNYFRGYWKDNSRITQGGNGTNPSNPPTSFMFPGDPAATVDRGWVDSNADDRRFLMTTGPFNMPPWEDTNGNGLPDFGEPGVQEIVACVMVARGTNNLNSVSTLKQVDALAQLAYDLNFKLAKAPLIPEVQVTELSNEIILTWGDISEYNEHSFEPYNSADPIVAKDFGKVTKVITLKEETVVDTTADPDTMMTVVLTDTIITTVDDSTYNFYGYSVYQFSDASGRDPVLIDHWDIGAVLDPMPYTERRFIQITENKHNAVGNVGNPLVNGKEYYFSVVAEGYLAYGSPKVLPSPIDVLTVIPQVTPGNRYSTSYNDTVDVVYNRVDTTMLFNDGSVIVYVVDPTKVTGHNYQIEFEIDTLGNTFWDLTDLTEDNILLADQTNLSGDDSYQIIDGLMIKVLQAPPGIKSIIETAWSGSVLSEPNDVWQDLNSTSDYYISGGGGTGIDRLERFADYAVPRDFEIRFTNAGGYAVYAFTDDQIATTPWEIWDIGINTPNDPSDDRRMIPFLNENIATGPAWGYATDEDLFKLDPDRAEGYPISDWIYWMDAETADGYNQFAAVCASNGAGGTYPYDSDGSTEGYWANFYGEFVYPIGRFVVADYALDGTPPPSGTTIRIVTYKPITTNDFFNFTAPDTTDLRLSNLKVDLKKVKVVPNPYYGYHKGEMDPFNQWVQFTHLPRKCTIRIFDLGGNLVRKLEKNDASTSLLKWNLKNEYELPVASGIYVFHIKAPGIGEKIGKMAIFMPKERLDTY
jgi:hypothetical protein